MLDGVERLVRRGPARRAIQEVLRSLDVVDAIRAGDEAFAFGYISVPDTWLPERHVAVLTSFVRQRGGWRVTGMTSDGYATAHRNVFESGSHVCSTIPLSTPDRASAVAAVCDPTVTRMETVASDGTVFDWDEPVDGIGLLLTEDAAGALRARRGADVLYATALANAAGPALVASELPSPGALRDGESLVDALLAEVEIELLGLHIHRSIALSIAAFAQVVREGSWELGTSLPAREPGWVRYVVVGDGTVGTIGVRFYRENRAWFITAVDLLVGG
jgi:hypothetical protein